MSESSRSTSKVQLKLLIDRKNETVLFAEASKEFIDFLFSLMFLPLGKVVNLLTKNKMVGCIGNLYDSIESLSETYIKSDQAVELVLNPKAPMFSFQNPLLLSNDDESSVNQKDVYFCSGPSRASHAYFAEVPTSKCPGCNYKMNYKLEYVESGSEKQVAAASSGGGGFVEGVVTYMVMDNLEVKAMSTISSIALMNTFNIKDLSTLEEKVVGVGVEEGMMILQLALQSKDVLSSVFLRNPQRA